MTPKPSFLYWRPWRAVCTHHGWCSADTSLRRDLHAHGGRASSMRGFKNRDFDRYLSYASQLLGGREDTEVEPDAGNRRRFIWRILADLRTGASFGEFHLY